MKTGQQKKNAKTSEMSEEKRLRIEYENIAVEEAQLRSQIANLDIKRARLRMRMVEIQA